MQAARWQWTRPLKARSAYRSEVSYGEPGGKFECQIQILACLLIMGNSGRFPSRGKLNFIPKKENSKQGELWKDVGG